MILNKEFFKKYRDPIIFVLLCIGLYILQTIENSQLKENGIYSIATVKEVKRAKRAKNGFSVKIAYIYKSETIVRNHASHDVDWSMIDKRLYVQFSQNAPNGNYRLICCNPVPDSIQNVPYEGWKVPPTYFKDINE